LDAINWRHAMSRRGAFVKLNSDSNSENGVRVRFTNYLSLNSAQQASSSFGGRSIDLHRIYLYFIIRNDLAAHAAVKQQALDGAKTRCQWYQVIS
jgi:hypothetical protein